MNCYRYHYQIQICADYRDWNSHLRTEEARIWCRQKFGLENTKRWGFFIDGFNFNDEKDYIMFLLRWS